MDKRYLLAFGMGAASLALGILVVRMIGLGPALPQLLPPEDLDPPQRSHDLSGPYTYKNLTVYLVHGENVLNDRTPLLPAIVSRYSTPNASSTFPGAPNPRYA